LVEYFIKVQRGRKPFCVWEKTLGAYRKLECFKTKREALELLRVLEDEEELFQIQREDIYKEA